ncbi:integrase core domain-containing protein [Streptomyces sp. NPDC047718]|uniref:integrase core domain-containing protein n=1 Tax=Streptomyces sp. NPDC047718 TaxID=3155479 RepID=UPI0033F90F15
MRRPIEPGQYTSHAFARLAADLGIRLSVGRTGVCWDNALAESFFATLKKLASRHHWHTHAAARTAIFEYTEGWSNTRRLHSRLGYQAQPSTKPQQPDQYIETVRQTGTISPPAPTSPPTRTP